MSILSLERAYVFLITYYLLCEERTLSPGHSLGKVINAFKGFYKIIKQSVRNGRKKEPLKSITNFKHYNKSPKRIGKGLGI